jgi:hypothetical protein
MRVQVMMAIRHPAALFDKTAPYLKQEGFFK